MLQIRRIVIGDIQILGSSDEAWIVRSGRVFHFYPEEVMVCLHGAYRTRPVGLLLDEVVPWMWTLFRHHAWLREYIKAGLRRSLAHVIAVIPTADDDDAHRVEFGVAARVVSKVACREKSPPNTGAALVFVQ